MAGGAPAGGPGRTRGRHPAVSIVVATHNRSAWLRAAIDSVLAQDYPDLEVLVVDDGSTDETPSVLEEYARRNPPRRFRFMRQENQGQARSLNRGYELARGEILGYLSDDDLLAPGAISRLAGELIADPDAAAAYPGYRVIDGEGRLVDTVRPIEYSSVEAVRLHDTIIGPGALARRAALEASGGWDPSLRWMGDLILWMGVGLAGRVIRVPEPLAFWRMHGGAATAQVDPDHAREHVRVAVRGLELPGLGPQPVAVRAEALRNACIVGSFWAGGADSGLGQRFTSIDLHRPLVSALAAGLRPGAEAGEQEEVAGLWRSICRSLTAIAELRRRLGTGPGGAGPLARSAAAPQGAGSGLERALARLRAVGVLAGPGQPEPGERDARDLRSALVEAAADCGADIDPETTRFLLVDRRSWPITDSEHRELLDLSLRRSIARLRAAAEEYGREAERLRDRIAALPSARERL